jgi:hypothetical protein
MFLLFCVEGSIVATLATALWRIGYGFVYEQYESSALLYNTAAQNAPAPPLGRRQPDRLAFDHNNC